MITSTEAWLGSSKPCEPPLIGCRQHRTCGADIVVVNRGGPGIATALQSTRLIADQGPRTHNRCEPHCGLGDCDDARFWSAHFEPASEYRDNGTSCSTSRSWAANFSQLTPVIISGRHQKWRTLRVHVVLTPRHGSLGSGIGRHASTAGSTFGAVMQSFVVQIPLLSYSG